MSLSNFIPELWTQQVLVNFRKNLVFGNLVNRDYEGEIRQAGDTVRITTPSAITVGAYSGTVSYQTPASTQQSLLIDQAQYWAFDLPDADQAQANVNLMSAYTAEAGVAMAGTIDAHLASLYTDAGSSVTGTLYGSTPDSIYEKMVEAGRKLDENNAPRAGRWVAVTPYGYSRILLESTFIGASVAGDALVRTGEVGSIAGFSVFVSNNIVMTNSGKDANYMFGTNAAITFAEQFTRTEAIRRDTAFSDGVRGLALFGAKVVRPAALGAFTATERA